MGNGHAFVFAQIKHLNWNLKMIESFIHHIKPMIESYKPIKTIKESYTKHIKPVSESYLKHIKQNIKHIKPMIKPYNRTSGSKLTAKASDKSVIKRYIPYSLTIT